MKSVVALRRVAVAATFAAALAFAWGRRERAPALPTLPVGMAYQSFHRTALDWTSEGYVEMAGPLRPPTSEDGRVRILVFVRWPDGAPSRAVRDGARWSLALPVGARAERVELDGDGPIDAPPTAGWRVLDVRGTSFTEAGERFRVLRPRTGSGDELFGLEWPRGDGQATATDILGQLVLARAVAAPAGDDARARAAAHLRGLNACPACHVPLSPSRQSDREARVVNRGTDAAGLFQVTSILRDRLPFETYRPRDANRGDPFVRRYCGDLLVDESVSRCPNGAILEGERDVTAGLRAGDTYTLRLCASRRELARHLDAGDRAKFEPAFGECGLGG
jgi:hypothetical protein